LLVIVLRCISYRLLVHFLQVFDLLFQVLGGLITLELKVVFLQLELLEGSLLLL